MLLTAARVLPHKNFYALAVALALALISLCAPLATLAAPAQQGPGYSPFIFVPNDGFATVTFRDSSSFDVRATVSVPTPNTSAINHSPDGSLLFLTNQGFTHQLEIIDVATQSVIAGVELPFRGLSNCNASSVLPVNDNTKIYVACEGHGHVEVAYFDRGTGQLTLGTPIFIGWPQSLQQVGSHVFVSDTQFNKLKRIDPLTDVVEDVIPHQSYIFDDAVVDPFRPYAYIVNPFGQRLLIANTFTHAISRTLQFDGELNDLLLAPDGERLYVTVDGGNGDDTIAVVEGLGELESVVTTIPVGPAAHHLASNDEGTCLYTWDFVDGKRRIDVIDTAHNLVSAQPIVAGGDADGDFVGPGASIQAVYLEPNSDNLNSFTVSEGAGSILLAVRRSCSAQGTVQVNYATQDGSGGDPAIAGQDYEATNGVLEFADGEVVKSIDIPIMDNELYGQPSRYFDLVLSNSSGAFLGERAVDTIRIDDDDPIPPDNDLQLYLSANPDPAIAGDELNYSIEVYNSPNNGGAEANDVVVTNVLPAGVAFIDVEMTVDSGGGGGGGDFFGVAAAGNGVATVQAGEVPEAGSCAAPAVGETGTVVCNVGTLNPAYDGAWASITIHVDVPPAAVNSDLLDEANVTTSNLDPYLENNSASLTTHVDPPGVAPRLNSISPAVVLANGPDFDLTLNGEDFFETATVQIYGADRTTTFVTPQQLMAAVPGYDIAGHSDVYVLPVRVVNPAPGGGVSNPQALAVVSDRVTAVQAAMAQAGTTLQVSTAPQSAGAAGVAIDLANNTDGSDDIAFAAATYNGNPTAAEFPGDVGGGFVDVYVVGAEGSDSATVNFYYASAAGEVDEATMELFYFDGYEWVRVLSSGGVDPVKDTTDNLDGTVSGGRFTVIFDSSSAPSICIGGYCGDGSGGESFSSLDVIDDLSATVFTMGNRPQPSADLVVSKDASANPVDRGSELSYYIRVNTFPAAGADSSANVLLTDLLPAGTTFVSADGYNSVSGEPVTCDTPAVGENGAVICQLGQLFRQYEGDAVYLTIVANVTVPGGSALENTVTVTSETPDPDAANNSATATVSVNGAPNQAPVALDDEVTTDEDTPANITLAATAGDGDALSYNVLTLPAHGTLSGDAPNLVYTPAADFHGDDSLTFQVNDGQADSNIATVSITVSPVNDPPVAHEQNAASDEDTAANITLTGSDVDGDALSYTVLTPPAHGILSGDAPNLVYTPAADFHGGDSLTFQVNDGQADSAVATVSIAVAPVNDDPTAVADSAPTPQDTPITVAVLANDSDVDGDSLTVSALGAAAHGVVTTDGTTVTYTPVAGYSGSDTFSYTADDGNGGSASAAVEITMTPSQPQQATITIVKDSQPDRPRRFRFTGSLGAFRLRDDGSNAENALTFTVNTGVYTVTEQVPGGWFLTDIVCTPATNAAVDLVAGQVVVTAAGGDNITCTFVNQKAALVRAFLFQDNNRNGTRQGREPVHVGWTVNLLDSQNQQVASAVTNQQGKVSFTNVRPGAHTVCEVLQNGLTHPQPCVAVQANPGETTAVTFANVSADVVRSAGADPMVSQSVSQFASPDAEDPDADEAILPTDDAWLTSEEPLVADESEFANKLFLPVITR